MAQQFAAAPQTVGSRGKYRPEDAAADGPGNLMHDRRVVRGSTYASTVAPQQDALAVQRQREAQQRRMMKANQTRKRSGTPEPVPGRKNMDIQTDAYLEELTERIVAFEAETQTDFILNRPQSPLFLPQKIGLDTETQVEQGDLFDFDVECEPILDVIVAKTLEQGMMEVLEEEELASLKAYQEDFEKKRGAELVEVQRQEAAEKRRHDEMLRRVQQQNSRRAEDLNMMHKVVSRSIANAHLSSLKDRALASLKDAGTFADSVQLAVQTQFMPMLLGMVSKQMALEGKDSAALKKIVSSALDPKMQAHARALEVERRRAKVVDDAERQARTEVGANQAVREQQQRKVLAEQEAMLAWEAEPPPKRVETAPVEVQVVEVNVEEKLATLADGTTLNLDDEAANSVAEMLAQLAEGQKVMGRLTEGGEGGPAVSDFRVAEAGEGEGAADGEANATAS